MQTSVTFKPNIHGVPKILVPRKKMSKFYTGTGVMARWLRALTILPEDPGLVPSTHMAALNHLTPVLGDLMPLLASNRTACTWCTETYVGKILIHTN